MPTLSSATLIPPVFRDRDENGKVICILSTVKIVDDIYGEFIVKIPIAGPPLQEVLIIEDKIEQGKAFQAILTKQIQYTHTNWVKRQEETMKDALTEVDIAETFGISSLTINNFSE